MASNISYTGIKCKCGIPCAHRTSWTLRNSGRKFITCKFYNRDSSMCGCGFFIWVDEDTTGWQRNIINDLLTENRSLKRELRYFVKQGKSLKKLQKRLMGRS
ncbi:hypothetical protein RND81_02G094000 [Saponaria officinalis]|uniref:GRF-type domain-containing protein n=1 Tax=Saponaria officinalis TaxID=3572 RepID=A0AAW1MVF7_SAPOF